MKTLLRTFALTAALALTAFATTGHAVTTNGNCHLVCLNPTTHMGSTLVVLTTEAQCCSSSFNPCPAGSSPTAVSFQPLGGRLQRCAA